MYFSIFYTYLSTLLHGSVIQIWQSCQMYFSSFAKHNQAAVWPTFQILLKLLLWNKDVDWVKAPKTLDPLSVWQCFFFVEEEVVVRVCVPFHWWRHLAGPRQNTAPRKSYQLSPPNPWPLWLLMLSPPPTFVEIGRRQAWEIKCNPNNTESQQERALSSSEKSLVTIASPWWFCGWWWWWRQWRWGWRWCRWCSCRWHWRTLLGVNAQSPHWEQTTAPSSWWWWWSSCPSNYTTLF